MNAALADATSLTVSNLPLPDLRLCGNGRASGFLRSRLRREQRKWGMLAALQALRGEPPPAWAAGPVGLEYDVMRTSRWAARKLDDDNFIAGMKGYRDGLADGLGTDDAAWRSLAVRWHTTIGGSGGVTVTLRPLAR